MVLEWDILHPALARDPEAAAYYLGYIGALLSDVVPLTAREQINVLYKFGGWRPMISERFKDLGDNVLKFPGDPPLRPLARAKLRDETVCMYQGEFWAVFQQDGSFEVARLD